MQHTRPLALTSLFVAVRRGLFATLVLSTPAFAVDSADAQTQVDPNSTSAPGDASKANEPTKPSLMSEVKVIGYQTSSATTATGVVTDIIDTPISISAINNQFIVDTGATQLMGIVESLPGVTGQNNSG